MSTIRLVRRPIFDKNTNVFAYELRCNQDDVLGSAQASETDNNDADVSELILQAFSDIGLDKVIGKNKAYINFSNTTLLNHIDVSLPKEKIIVDISTNDNDSNDITTDVAHLAKKGGFIVLDHEIFQREKEGLAQYANIIKFDVAEKSKEEIEEMIAPYDKEKVKLFAKNIKTHESAALCKELGFNYYQGEFLSKPNVIECTKASSNRMVVLKLVSELHSPDVEISNIALVLAQDTTLTYKLLKMINSAAYATQNKIQSVKQAIIRLGTDKIRNWVTLITLSDTVNKPSELMISTMLRAKMCEQLAIYMKDQKKNVAFTVGLFSTLDAMLDRPLEELLAELPFTQEIKDALLKHEGTLGEILENTIAYENGEWSKVNYAPLDEDKYCLAYMESLEWANEVCSALLK